MAHELTFEEIQNCKKVFDENRNQENPNIEDDHMNINNLDKAIEALNFKIEGEELDEIIKNMNLKKEIDFPTFLRIAAIKYKQVEFVKALGDAFKAFDKNNKGYLTFDELRSIVTDYGPKLSIDQADNLLKELGIENSNKKFRYQEFVEKNI